MGPKTQRPGRRVGCRISLLLLSGPLVLLAFLVGAIRLVAVRLAVGAGLIADRPAALVEIWASRLSARFLLSVVCHDMLLKWVAASAAGSYGTPSARA
jgi:hypothetical protein